MIHCSDVFVCCKHDQRVLVLLTDSWRASSLVRRHVEQES